MTMTCLRRIDMKLVVAFVWHYDVSQLPTYGILRRDWYHMHGVVSVHCITLWFVWWCGDEVILYNQYLSMMNNDDDVVGVCVVNYKHEYKLLNLDSNVMYQLYAYDYALYYIVVDISPLLLLCCLYVGNVQVIRNWRG